MTTGKNQVIHDSHIVELTMSDDERKAYEAYEAKMSAREIRKKIFKNKISRQAVFSTIRRAQLKMFRMNSRERYKDNPGACPIGELPVTARIRCALERAGFKKLGDLAGMSRDELADIDRMGRVAGLVVYTLMEDWGVRKPKSFCPNCGKEYHSKLNAEKDTVRKCVECGYKTKIEVIDIPLEAEPVAATA